jgi:hypothetical protein
MARETTEIMWNSDLEYNIVAIGKAVPCKMQIMLGFINPCYMKTQLNSIHDNIAA